MEIYDTVQAHTVEVGDQILVVGHPIEVTEVSDDPDNPDLKVFWGISYDEGDAIRLTVPFDELVDLWAV